MGKVELPEGFDENPEWTEETERRSRPASEILPPHAVAALTRRPRGRPPGGDKEATTIRLDRDVLAHFKGQGSGWQTRINAALRKVAGL
ncbi:uncharacterized protein (DUF4415 family) [Sphingomonas vulcanisoli]|uniref:Uncharacterized protein (DUF4415 family) n=1 Tax=Sphingomonas vulcanisoli TaxID=1658060 RepID=A0ABX0TS41_9SPHN|nr:BrnA antitoxin family protein [Sphingomonas vulcanisoli]NIJ07544.1 uncharacterized protein (DUF4415 family) [Sphingomonas vulcanisoli]